MTTATATTITNQALTFDNDIRGDEVTLHGVTGSADVHARILRVRNSTMDQLRVMAQHVIIENSVVDTLQAQNPDWFWGRDENTDVTINLSHVYVVRAEHLRTLSLDRAWLREIMVETLGALTGNDTHIDEMWVRWGSATVDINGCAIGRSNLPMVDCGADHGGNRMNLMVHPESGTVTVTYKGRKLHLQLAKEVFDDNTELTAMLKSGMATIKRKEEIYS